MAADPPPIAVTGSTGGVGGAVARQLSAAGVPVRLLVRDPARAPQLPGAQVFRCSYADRDASSRALDGVQTLLMVSASESADRLDQHRAFVDSAAAAGVAHVVYTSFVGASPTCTFTLGRDHHATEQHILAAGLEHTFLRDNFYQDVMPAFVGDDGVLRGPAGDGRAALVARSDVARTAAVVLQDPGAHGNVTYDLTGPEALTLTEVAEQLTAATGRPVRFHSESVPEAYESRRKWGAPDWQNDAWVSTYTAIGAGELAAVSPDVERVTGRRPISLADFLSGAD